MSSDLARNRRSELWKAVRARFHRTVGTWRIDRGERAQLRGLADLWRGSGRPLILSVALVSLTMLADAFLPAGVLGGRTPGPDVSQAVLALFGGVLALLGLAVVQSAADRYRRYIVDQLADDPARDAFLTLLFIGFTVTILQLAAVTAGVMRPALGLLIPIATAIAVFGLLTQYLRQRIRWLKPSEIVRHLALDVGRHERTMLTPATALVVGSVLSRQHREAMRDLLRLLSLALDGLAEGEPATIDDAVAAYRAYTRAVMDHAKQRVRAKGPLAAVLMPRPAASPERLLLLRDERLLRALLSDSRSRTGSGRPARAAEDAALWFEQLAVAAAATPLMAVLANGRGRDDEFAEDWCEQLPAWFWTTREEGDLVMGLAILDMLATLPAAFGRLAETGTPAPALPVDVLDAITETATATTRLERGQLVDWNVSEELRTTFLARAAATYLALLTLTSDEVQERQRTLARNSRSRLYGLGWLAAPAEPASDEEKPGQHDE